MKRFFYCISLVAVIFAVLLVVHGNQSETQSDLFPENVEALSDPEIYTGPFCVDDDGLCIYYYKEWELLDIYDGVLLPYYG